MNRTVRIALMILLSFCLHPVWAAAAIGEEGARHLLGRAGFGASDTQTHDWARLTRQQAVDRLLFMQPTTPTVPVPANLRVYERRQNPNDLSPADFKAWTKKQREAGVAMRAWWVDAMAAAHTPERQLRERMVLFWHNHFVSSNQKVRSTALMLQQNQLFRTHALGNFGALLHAVAKDPAMVIYLDSASNRKGSPNENFAREVMELFTLGEGRYSETDIKEAARAFTGWSIDRDTGEFRWRAFQHDDGVKTVLGKAGRHDGDAVLDILLAQPATAEFIAAKLWREFVSPTPTAAGVLPVARRLRESGYDVREALRALLTSEEFWAKENRQALIKSPVDLLLGTVHAFDIPIPDGRVVAMALREMGQDLFVPPNVRGWPGGEHWVNSSSLLARKSVLERLLGTAAIRRLSESERVSVRSELLDSHYQVK
jgi:uncharacterized protein (DUF1800 family)